ncbi:hypothetical protein QZM46_26345 [Burkholderia vietnamiensis]|nr:MULTISPECIES: hypothetical protein [Burkholderia]AOK02705.1 hypothetical protein WK23_29005 [Burkholderia vietnamiensis]AOK45143.1 hypothetical protein WL96_29130 [Burkholderia vietnamiensis]KVE20085.1 hypothetical protein WI92_28550 [Burkholderia vietnamiensis]KVF07741.1 hypothetical protein WJ04_12445 [Burkholderia vietnamiensis]KVF13352.1 hypothetical protein WJ05_11075 [Burkholderia vietnamiensis]
MRLAAAGPQPRIEARRIARIGGVAPRERQQAPPRHGDGYAPFITYHEESTMARIGAFCLTTWLAAAILYFGQHSLAMIALSGVVVFGGFDLLRP